MATDSLPRQVTRFIGREEEITALTGLLSDPACRLLTLTGPGGIGKTSLAVEVARQMSFPDGAYFVALQAIDTGANLISSIADAIAPRLNNGDDPQQLHSFLSDKQMLLILDNFEHLLDSVVRVTDILSATTQLKLMVTSRARLNLQAEQVWRVRGLGVPKDAHNSPDLHSAIQLFVERAKRTEPHFSFADQSTSVVRVCQLVNGSPLALELAASWVGTMSCETIVGEIQRSIDFLTTSHHDVASRHQSIRAVFDHSWHLLTTEERVAFRELSIFRGGFTAEAATQVAGASLSILASLTNKSLVQLGADGRYQIHELLQRYAEERLAEVPQAVDKTRTRHAQYFANYVYQAHERMFHDLDQQAINEVRSEIANLEAGLQWELQRGAFGSVCMYAPMSAQCYQAQGLLNYGERTFQTWAGYVRAHFADEERNQALGCILTYLAWMIHLQARNHEAIALLEECLILLDHPDTQEDFAQALAFLGRVRRVLGQFQPAMTLLQQALSIFRALKLSMGIWMSLGLMGEIAFDLGAYDEAQRYLEETLKMEHSPAGFVRRYSLSILGLICATKLETAQARDHLLAAIRTNQDTPDVLPGFYMLAGIAMYLMAQRQDDEAAEVFFVIAKHPIADAEIQDRIRPHLAGIQSRLSPQALSNAEQRADSALTVAQRIGANVILAPAYFDQLTRWLEFPQSETRSVANRALVDPLSPRELEVLVLIAEGFTNREIAGQLFTGVSTIKKHINHIYSKLDVSDRDGAVNRARILRLIS